MTNPVMAQLLDALTALGLATGVARSSLVYGAVSAGHVFGIALLVGPILLVDLTLLGIVRALDARAIATLRATARIGLTLVLVTGVLLVSSKPDEYLTKMVFLTKMTIVAAGIANALLFEWRTRRRLMSAVGYTRWDHAAGAASLVLWLTALMLGRAVAFV
jgi:hypothetical protein